MAAEYLHIAYHKLIQQIAVYLHIQQIKTNINTYLEPLFWPPAEHKSNILS